MVVVFGPKYVASLYQYTCGPIFAAVLTHSLKYTSCCTRNFLSIAVAVINSENMLKKWENSSIWNLVLSDINRRYGPMSDNAVYTVLRDQSRKFVRDTLYGIINSVLEFRSINSTKRIWRRFSFVKRHGVVSLVKFFCKRKERFLTVRIYMGQNVNKKVLGSTNLNLL